jgi:magnesium chelatase accessory protein
VAGPLAREFTVIIPDLPGHGFSAPAAAGEASLPGMSKALLALLETLEVTPQMLVGHSAGAAIAAWIGLHGALPVQHVVAINGAVSPLRGVEGQLFSPLAKLLSMTSLAPTLFSALIGDRVRVQRMLVATGSNIDERGVELYERLLRDRHHVAGALTMMAQWNLDELAREITALPAELHLIAGSNDRTVSPAQSRRLSARLPRADLQILDGLGHLAHEEQPALIAQTLIAMLKKPRANTDTGRGDSGHKIDTDCNRVVI